MGDPENEKMDSDAHENMDSDVDHSQAIVDQKDSTEIEKDAETEKLASSQLADDASGTSGGMELEGQPQENENMDSDVDQSKAIDDQNDNTEIENDAETEKVVSNQLADDASGTSGGMELEGQTEEAKTEDVDK